MNNEETIIMQPQNTQNNKAAESKNETKNEANNTKEVKNEGKGNTAQKVGATIAAGVGGGAIGGGAAAYAANQMNEEPVEEEVKVETAPEPAKPEPTPQPEEPKEEEIIVEPDDTVEPDYPGYGGADPVVNEPQPQQTGDEGGQEIQVLGVYENEEGQEMAVLTDGETIAAVVDTTGDDEANIIWVDGSDGSPVDGVVQEGEIHDISDQHIGMEQFEQEYLAQQQMEMEQQDTFAYNAADETDYNNDVDTYDMV